MKKEILEFIEIELKRNYLSKDGSFYIDEINFYDGALTQLQILKEFVILLNK